MGFILKGVIETQIFLHQLQLFLLRLIINIGKKNTQIRPYFLFGFDSISALPLFFETNASRPFSTWKSCNFCLRFHQSKCTNENLQKIDSHVFYGCSSKQRISFSNEKIIMAQFVINGMKVKSNCACYLVEIVFLFQNNE